MEKSDKMTTEIVLFFISCFISLTFGGVCIRYLDYKSSLTDVIKSELSTSKVSASLGYTISKNMRKVYYENTHLFSKHICLVSLILWVVTCIANSYYYTYDPNYSMVSIVVSTIIVSIVSFIFSGFILFLFLRDTKLKKPNVNAEDIFKVYFNKIHPKKANILTPIYIQTKILKNRHMLKELDPNRRPLGILSKFGKNLDWFTLQFEKAFTEQASINVFNLEILKSENIDLLAKLISIIEDPKLLEQLNLNEQASAQKFNCDFEKMVDDLTDSIIEIKEVSKNLKVSDKELRKQQEANKVSEKLDLLLNQNFTKIT